MAAIGYFANIAAPWGALQKSKQYDMWAKSVLLGESEPTYP